MLRGIATFKNKIWIVVFGLRKWGVKIRMNIDLELAAATSRRVVGEEVRGLMVEIEVFLPNGVEREQFCMEPNL